MPARNPFGIHTNEPLFDIYDTADLVDQPVWTTRRLLKAMNVEAVARDGKRLLYRASDFMHHIPRPDSEPAVDEL